MELDDVKKALNADGLKSDLKLRKAARLIAGSAVAVAPKAPEAPKRLLPPRNNPPAERLECF